METSLLPTVENAASKTNPSKVLLARSAAAGADFTAQSHMRNSPQAPPHHHPLHFPSYLPRTNSARRLISRRASPTVQPSVSGSAGNANGDHHAKESGLETAGRGRGGATEGKEKPTERGSEEQICHLKLPIARTRAC